MRNQEDKYKKERRKGKGRKRIEYKRRAGDDLVMKILTERKYATEY